MFTLFVTLLGLHGAFGSCLDAAKLKQDFIFEGQALDLCNPRSLGFYTVQTLNFLRELPDLTLEKSKFNQNLIDQVPYDFFKARVKRIVLSTADSDQCPDQRLAYVSPVEREDKKIYICPNSLNFNQVTFSSALLHESRHVEGPQYVHQPCVTGPYAGQFSCDDSYEDGGSYAIGLEFLVKLARNPKLDPDLRAQARAAAVVDFLQRFNRPPLDIQQGALLRAGTSLVFYDGEKELRVDVPLLPDTVLSLQGGLPLLFNPSLKQVQRFEYLPKLVDPIHDVLTDDFMSNPLPLLDVIYTDRLACLLSKASVKCYRPDRTTFTRDLSGLKPKKFFFSERSRVVASGVISILDEAGVLHDLQNDSAQSQVSPYLAVQPWWGGEITLKTSGEVEMLSYRGRVWSPAKGLTPRAYSELKAPFFWSNDLNEL